MLLFCKSASLCSWVVVYSRDTPQARVWAVWVIVGCMTTVFAAWGLAATRSALATVLLSPLIAWLLFAVLLSFTEVQLEASIR